MFEEVGPDSDGMPGQGNDDDGARPEDQDFDDWEVGSHEGEGGNNLGDEGPLIIDPEEAELFGYDGDDEEQADPIENPDTQMPSSSSDPTKSKKKRGQQASAEVSVVFGCAP